MAQQINRLVVGTRFKVNQLGSARCPALAGKTGTVTGMSYRNTGVAVLFDGTKRPTYLHRDFISSISDRSLTTDEAGYANANPHHELKRSNRLHA
ncbi:hypothetical protein JQ629_36105 [Bradyrhizobium sp. AUGA SZCCT0222]|uniref:hypothetical protein n=1 Tax=Bradyrhizobium sp. AUGA SZCCT0222 TaxID=2807668 RepID=UPI001BADFC46|nr:hypothetical protein [Bradyrhizobium sp. AUGA SZCCT0222]MBR1272906.1 hypothetical protein [Bradyrhizobium sp. AUGA SZCCT0222]